MKYAITGHTKGIGKAFASLPHVKDNFVGFSRGNGYNIRKLKIVERLLEKQLIVMFLLIMHISYTIKLICYMNYTRNGKKIN